MKEVDKMSLSYSDDNLKVTCSLAEKKRLEDLKERKLYLYGEIADYDTEEGIIGHASKTGEIVEQILGFNEDDRDIPAEEREPIKLYIDSPGGNQTEGFSLVDAIQLSKTPIYTVNLGEWSSMSFLIGITGHKRFSFPSATFLLHDGSSGAFGSTNKVQDRVKFEERYELEVVKQHVLRHSNMNSEEYDALARVEYYMLPADALKKGFIDEIVSDVNTIL